MFLAEEGDDIETAKATESEDDYLQNTDGIGGDGKGVLFNGQAELSCQNRWKIPGFGEKVFETVDEFTAEGEGGQNRNHW